MDNQNKQQKTIININDDNDTKKKIIKYKTIKCSNQNFDTKMALLSGGLLLFSILSIFSCSYCVYLDEYSSNHIQHSINLLLICIIELIIGSQNMFNRFTKKKIIHTLIEIDILVLIIGFVTLLYALYKRNDILLDYVVPINIMSLIISIYYLRLAFKMGYRKIPMNHNNNKNIDKNPIKNRNI